MRKIFLLLAALWLGAVVTVPSHAAGSSITGLIAGNRDVVSRLAKEGQQFNSVVYNITGVDTTAWTYTGAGHVLGGIAPLPLHGNYIDSFTVSVNTGTWFNIFFFPSAETGVGTFSGTNWRFYVPAGTTTVIPVKQYLIQGRDTYYAIYVSALDSVATSYEYSISASGYSFAPDLNFGASKTVLFVGDSTFYGGVGPSTLDKFIVWRMTNFWRLKGVNCRMILQAISGSTSTYHATQLGRGTYDYDSGVDLIVYNLGINDAVQGYSTATAVANLNAWIARKQIFYPRAKMLVLGPTPIQDNTNNSTLTSIETALSGAVTASGDLNIKYKSMQAAFDRTVGGNYATSDGADGTRIHPNDTGWDQVWNGGYLGYDGIAAWLTTNLPTF